ncbi:MAG: hypothetical protein LBQ66_00215 [Planctomycetaceae bacterium]|nr:hypothetical protein [Planctomycetaceae bacterium]
MSAPPTTFAATRGGLERGGAARVPDRRRYAANLCGITRAGTPRSSPRRFAANVVGGADIGRFGFASRNSNAFHAPLGRGQASPLQHQRFLVLGDRNSGAFWRFSCRLAPT